MKIVSSHLTDNAYMLMARVFGNLGLFVASKRVAHRDVVELHVLNLAKMDKLDSWLEKMTPQSVNAALKAAAGRRSPKATSRPNLNSWEAQC